MVAVATSSVGRREQGAAIRDAGAVSAAAAAAQRWRVGSPGRGPPTKKKQIEPQPGCHLCAHDPNALTIKHHQNIANAITTPSPPQPGPLFPEALRDKKRARFGSDRPTESSCGTRPPRWPTRRRQSPTRRCYRAPHRAAPRGPQQQGGGDSSSTGNAPPPPPPPPSRARSPRPWRSASASACSPAARGTPAGARPCGCRRRAEHHHHHHQQQQQHHCRPRDQTTTCKRSQQR